MAAILLSEGLKDYHALLNDRNRVNNYWKQIKSQLTDTKNDPSKWQSALDDADATLNFVKPLACQKTNTLACKGKCYGDRDIEKLMNKLKTKGDAPQRSRKIPLVRAASGWRTGEHAEPPKLPSGEQNMTVLRSSSFSKHSSHADEQSRQRRLQSNLHKQASYPNLDKFVQRAPSRTLANGNVNTKGPRGPSKQCAPKSRPPVRPRTTASDEDAEAPSASSTAGGFFRSAREELNIQERKNGGRPTAPKTLGGRVAVNSKFVCPFKRDQESHGGNDQRARAARSSGADEPEDERLRNIEPNMIELIRNEIMDTNESVMWDDVAGLEYTKKIVKEVVVFPMLRPDIFTGLRRPPKGILLFGPPGTGKTLIGKCIASQSRSTFFSISASSLTSKWIGEGEKMVRALFAVARVHQPSVVFIDEIDSLLTQRSETEHESSRRLKTEFLVQLDGAATSDEDRILIVGATNRPQELDEAARRRLVKRLYVPLPELEARKQIIDNLLASVRHDLRQEDVARIAERTAGYSGADMTNLCKEASMEPIRSIPFSQLEDIEMEKVRHITSRDFDEALNNVRPSVSRSDLDVYIDWDRTYGSGSYAQQSSKA